MDIRNNQLTNAVRAAWGKIAEKWQIGKNIVSDMLDNSPINYFREVDRNHLDNLKALIRQNNININTRENDNGDTLLITAVKLNHTEIARYLLQEAKADTNIQNFAGKTALSYAVQNHNTELAAALLAHNAKTDLKDNNGISPLMQAVADKNETLTCLLMQADSAFSKILRPSSKSQFSARQNLEQNCSQAPIRPVREDSKTQINTVSSIRQISRRDEHTRE